MLAVAISSSAETADPLNVNVPDDGRVIILIALQLLSEVSASVKAKSLVANVLLKFAQGVLSP